MNGKIAIRLFKNSTNFVRFFLFLLLIFIYINPIHAQESPEKKRPKIGVVLSGGGARGFAHIGVLQWFEEHHIPVDAVAGTSMGGLIGGMYAIGKTPQEMKDIAFNIDWVDLFRPQPAYSDLDFRRKQDRRDYPNAIELGLKHGLKLPSGLNSGHQIGILFSDLTFPYSEVGSFDNLPIPFRCIATDMIEAKPVVLSDGSLALALQSTMSIPGVFAPVEIQNKILASDGGLLNNIPTDVMKTMGVDIVIGVDIGTPLGKRESMSSITGVLGQMIGVVTIENVRRNRELADILIVPDLKQYFTMDFQAARRITDLGYAGTEQAASKLLPLALNDQDWEAHMNARRARIRTTVPDPQFITVSGTTESASQEIEHSLKEFVGQPVDKVALNKDLTRIWGRGRYLAVGYQMTEANDQQGLLIRASEKPYAPPFLNLALEMNNTRSDVLDVNLRGRVTIMDFLSEGSEVRLDASIGSELSIGAEYFHLLGQTHFFLAPYAFTRKTRVGIFQDEEQIAQYNFRESSVGGDAGYQFGTTSEVRLGYQVGHVKASRDIGDPVLPELSGQESEMSLRFLHDSSNSAVIPTRGLLLASNLRYVFDSPVLETSENDESFTQFAVRAAGFFPFGAKNTLFAIAEADTSFDRHPGAIEQFTVGGLFRVSGLSNDEFRGDHAILGGVGYLRKLADMPPLLGEKISAGGWYEFGSAFDDWDDKETFHSFSAGLIVETILGPIFVGGSVATEGRSNFFFAIGRFF